MKKLFYIAIGLLILIISFALNTLNSTGFFREIKNSDFELKRSLDIPGAEDFAINREEGFLLISSDDRAARFTDRKRTGGIYKLDLKQEGAVPVLISGDFDKPFFPHGISLYKIDSAMYKLLVINHVDDKNYVEVFLLQGNQLTHQKTLQDELLASPNDIVAIDQERFYYTNDHLTNEGFGMFAANYLGKADANVGYYDGEKFSIVAEDIHYANGINFDPTKKLLYVAALRSFSVKVYNKNDNGTLNFIEDIDCKTGVDNIELDENGKLWIGCHPSLLKAKDHLTGKSDYAPSEVISIQYNSTGNYDVESIYLEDGKTMSASSVAVPYKNELFIGNVLDDHFISIQN